MPVDTLLRPDNRLLGLGTGDFSFYGAQPTDGVVAARIGTVEGAVSPILGPAPAPTGVSAGSGPADTLMPAVDADQAGAAPTGAGAAATSASQPGPLAPEARASDGVDGQLPVGGGSTSPLILAQSPIPPADGDAVAGDAATTPVGATALDGALAPTDVAQTLQAATSPLLDLLAGGTSPLAVSLGQVETTLAGTAQALGELVGEARAEVDGLASGVRSDVADLVGGVRGDLGDTLTAAETTLGGLTDTVTGAVQAPVHDIDALLFSGSDPAGGIATLVDLVQTSELFTVGQPSVPDAPNASGSIVDDLIADVAAASPLLGDDGDHHDLFGDDGPHLGL